jgi:hypothetical protein
LMGLYLSSVRALPAAQAGRGLSFMLLSLFDPGNKQAAGALQRLGVNRQFIAEQGAMPAIQKIWRAIDPKSRVQLTRLKDMPITDEMGEAEVTPETLRGLGISGQGLELLSTIFTRIHGLRTFAALMGQGSDAVQADQNTMHDAVVGTAAALAAEKKEHDDFVRRQPLTQLAKELEAMRWQIGRDIAPALSFFAREIGTPLGGFLTENKKARVGTEIGIGALLLGLGAWRLKGGRGPGLGGLAGGATALGALGAEGLGASPQNPMFVVVVGNLFGPGGITGTRAPWDPRNAPMPDAPGRAGRWGRLGGRLGRLGRWGGRFGRGLLRPGVLGPAALLGAGMWAQSEAMGEQPNPDIRSQRHLENFLRVQRLNRPELGFMGRNVMQLYRAQERTQFGQAYLDLDVLVKQPDGTKERKKYHVPLEFHKAGVTPGNRGKAGKKG